MQRGDMYYLEFSHSLPAEFCSGKIWLPVAFFRGRSDTLLQGAARRVAARSHISPLENAAGRYDSLLYNAAGRFDEFETKFDKNLG